MRPYTEYADRLYLDITGPAHIVPWGDSKTSLCGITATAMQWYGTGDWDETEHAQWLTLCAVCHKVADPDNAEDPAVATWREALTNND